MPSSLHAESTRSAISPRLAIRIFRNIFEKAAFGRTRRLFPAARADTEKRLAVFHGLAVFGVDFDELAGNVRFDLVHELHGFDNAEHLPGIDIRAHGDELVGA